MDQDRLEEAMNDELLALRKAAVDAVEAADGGSTDERLVAFDERLESVRESFAFVHRELGDPVLGTPLADVVVDLRRTVDALQQELVRASSTSTKEERG